VPYSVAVVDKLTAATPPGGFLRKLASRDP